MSGRWPPPPFPRIIIKSKYQIKIQIRKLKSFFALALLVRPFLAPTLPALAGRQFWPGVGIKGSREGIYRPYPCKHPPAWDVLDLVVQSPPPPGKFSNLPCTGKLEDEVRTKRKSPPPWGLLSFLFPGPRKNFLSLT